MSRITSTPKPAAKSAPDVDIDEAEQARQDAVANALKDNPEIAEEIEGLTIGEQVIRLRQRGLINFDVQ